MFGPSQKHVGSRNKRAAPIVWTSIHSTLGVHQKKKSELNCHIFKWTETPKDLSLWTDILSTTKHYSIRPKIVFVLALKFYAYVQMDDDVSRHIYKHIHQVLYESINYLKRILIWNRGSIVNIEYDGLPQFWDGSSSV
jgi:hypothetical protein